MGVGSVSFFVTLSKRKFAKDLRNGGGIEVLFIKMGNG
jgi:hypothetical protein